MVANNSTNASVAENANATGPFVYNDGDFAWVIVSTALVFIMIPGLAFFYGGMARTKNALSLILVVVLCMAVVSVQVTIFAVIPVPQLKKFSCTVVDLGFQFGI